MEFKYIFAIVILSVFLLLIFISFAILELGRIKDEKLQVWIIEQYKRDVVNKFDYDAENDEEIPLPEMKAVEDEPDIEDDDVADVHIEDPYGKIDIEGIEEITGNYNGDK